MRYWGEVHFYPEVGSEFLETPVNKLGTIINHYEPRYTESVYNVLPDEFLYVVR